MASTRALVNALLILSFAFVVRSADYNCVYTIYVRTGSILKAGTDSKVTLQLWDKSGAGVEISNIEEWGGLMGPKYDYFERGHLDVFSGRGPCLSGPVCGLKVISDGTGPHPGWYLNYVEVSTTGPHIQCAQQQFDVEQWLGPDVAPYELTATRNFCPYDLKAKSRPSKVVPNIESVTSV